MHPRCDEQKTLVSRGQGTFEYVLLLGGALLVVVASIVVLQTNFLDSQQAVFDVQLKQCKAAASQDSECYSGSIFQPGNTFSALSVPEGTLCDCSNFDPDAFSVVLGGEGEGQGSIELPGPEGQFAASRLDFATQSGVPQFEPSPDVLASTPTGGWVATWYTDEPLSVRVIPPRSYSDSEKQQVKASVAFVESPRQAIASLDASAFRKTELSDSSTLTVYEKNGDTFVSLSHALALDVSGPGSAYIPLPADQVSIENVFPRPSRLEFVEGSSFVKAVYDDLSFAEGDVWDLVVKVDSTESVDALFDSTESVARTQPRVAYSRPSDSSGECAIDVLGHGVFCDPTPAPAPSASPEPGLCAVAGESCGGLFGGNACCQGLTCKEELFGLLGGTCFTSNNEPLPSPSPSPSPTPSIQIDPDKLVFAEEPISYLEQKPDALPSPEDEVDPNVQSDIDLAPQPEGNDLPEEEEPVVPDAPPTSTAESKFRLSSQSLSGALLASEMGQTGSVVLDVVRDKNGHLYAAVEYGLFANLPEYTSKRQQCGGGVQPIYDCPLPGVSFLYPGVGLLVSKDDGTSWELVAKAKQLYPQVGGMESYTFFNEEHTNYLKEQCESSNEHIERTCNNLWVTEGCPGSSFCNTIRNSYCGLGPDDPDPPVELRNCDAIRKEIEYEFTVSSWVSGAVFQGMAVKPDGGVSLYYALDHSRYRAPFQRMSPFPLKYGNVRYSQDEFHELISPYLPYAVTLSYDYELHRLDAKDGKLEGDVKVQSQSWTDERNVLGSGVSLKTFLASHESDHFFNYQDLKNYVGTVSEQDLFVSRNNGKAAESKIASFSGTGHSIESFVPTMFKARDGKYYSFLWGRALYRLNEGSVRFVYNALPLFDGNTAYTSAFYADDYGLHVAYSSYRARNELYHFFIPLSKVTARQEHPYTAVTVTEGPNCQACEELKQFLQEKGVSYDAVSQPVSEPKTTIAFSDGERTVDGFDKLKLARLLQLELVSEPIGLTETTRPQLFLGKKQDGLPVLYVKTESNMEQYTYAANEWKKKDLGAFEPPDTSRGNRPRNKAGQKTFHVRTVQPPSDSGFDFMVVTKKQGVQLWGQYTAPQYDYNFYAGQALQASDQPGLYTALSERVPYQEFEMSLGVPSESTPSMSFEGTPSGVVTITPKNAGNNVWNALVKIDLRSRMQGGRLLDDAVTGVLKVSFDERNVEVPFVFPVFHVVREEIAYAAPSNLLFLKNGGKSVKKQVALVNNFDGPLVFSCGSVFSKSVPAKSVDLVDVSATQATCLLTLDGKPTAQKLKFEVNEVPDALSDWAKEDKLADSWPFNAPVWYRSCAEGYCSCVQAKSALSDFDRVVSKHVAQINAQSIGSTVSKLYPSYSEKMVLRTGSFWATRSDGETCEGVIGNAKFSLQPGRVYEIEVVVDSDQNWLAYDFRGIEKPVDLLPAYSVASRSGPVVDSAVFERIV